VFTKPEIGQKTREQQFFFILMFSRHFFPRVQAVSLEHEVAITHEERKTGCQNIAWRRGAPRWSLCNPGPATFAQQGTIGGFGLRNSQHFSKPPNEKTSQKPQMRSVTIAKVTG